MNLLYPKLPLSRVPAMLRIACLGALIAGLYGILHDQITYSISPDYFTRMKFRQFHWANFGFPVRVFVAEIGFLASWWVGMFGGWALARVSIRVPQVEQMFPIAWRGFAIVFGFAAVAAVIGYFIGVISNPQPETSELADFAASIGIADANAFARVAYIHNASYLGGLAGIFVAMFVAWRSVRATTAPGSTPPPACGR